MQIERIHSAHIECVVNLYAAENDTFKLEWEEGADFEECSQYMRGMDGERRLIKLILNLHEFKRLYGRLLCVTRDKMCVCAVCTKTKTN